MHLHRRTDDTVGAQPIGGPHRPPPLAGQDRICACDGCGTILSVYNDDPFCARHSFMHVSAGSARHPRLTKQRSLPPVAA